MFIEKFGYRKMVRYNIYRCNTNALHQILKRSKSDE